MERKVGYATAKVWDEIVRSRGHEPIFSMAEEAANMAGAYTMATDDERAEIEYLVGNFKLTDKPSNDLYNAVYQALFGGDWPVTIGTKDFLKAFTANHPHRG